MKNKIDEVTKEHQDNGLSALFCSEDEEETIESKYRPITKVGEPAKYLRNNLHLREAIKIILSIRLGFMPTNAYVRRFNPKINGKCL